MRSGYTTTTVNYGWRDISEAYTVHCTECNKALKRFVKSGYNNLADADYRAAARANLQEEAKEMAKKPVTCNSCKLGKLSNKGTLEVLNKIQLNTIVRLEKEAAELLEAQKINIQYLNKHYHRVFTYENEQYVMVGASAWDDGKFKIHGYRISKVKPWETISNKDCYAPIADVVWHNETLKDRQEAVNAK